MTVTAKDLRFKIAMLFDALSNGEDITITYRGKAKLVPANKKPETREDIVFGIWSDRDDSVDDMVRDLRKGRSFDV